MAGYQKNGHAVYDIKYHVIWVTKYRYQVLSGQVAIRLRELIRQRCEARGVTILQRSVGKEHIHLLISCPPSLAPSKNMQYLKGRSSMLLQDEISELKKRYWGATFMVQRLLLCNCQQRDGRNHSKLYCKPVQ
jgi:Transposase and inactivated derivatives